MGSSRSLTLCDDAEPERGWILAKICSGVADGIDRHWSQVADGVDRHWSQVADGVDRHHHHGLLIQY